ncbi:hypothetical protein D6764_02115 [Candidatus Woesearchaeota archaeon]|nr:MAG: hypothetical protein D6764_02115 [Candidatus Woesearchaeota archaeon]
MAIEVSNKTLAFLLVTAIVISLGGTLISLNKLGKLGATGITGAAAGTGNVSLTIGVDTTLNVVNGQIDFGTGSITGGNSYAILDSDYDPNVYWSGSEVAQFITLQNDGNVKLNITFNSTATAAEFIGGTSPDFNYTVRDFEAGSCTIGLASGENTVALSDNPVCESLAVGTAGNSYADTVNISVRLFIPVDASQTATTVNFTFMASQALN